MKFEYKKSLGQNFLKDNKIIENISNSINPSKGDLIIEIGPGAGALTRRLVDKGCDVLCFEIDERLRPYLFDIKSNNLKIVFDDFLKVNLNKYIEKEYKRIYFVGNLPYYITTAIINKIINDSNPYEIIIMIQKEVADRFKANPNTKEYNSLSVFLQYNFDITKVCNVSRKCFEPEPKVDSIVLKLKRKELKERVNNEEFFYKLIKDSFKQKRKNLRNNLREYNLEELDNILNSFGKSLRNRAEEITIEEFIIISNKMSS